MWSAFGEELSVLLAADRIRIRRFAKRTKQLLFETQALVSADAEAGEQWRLNIQSAMSPRTRTAKLFIAENLCEVGWVPMPEQQLSPEEVDALVRAQTFREGHARRDVSVVFDSHAAQRGAVFAVVDGTLLHQVIDVLEHVEVRVRSAEPVLAAVVSHWLSSPATRTAKQRHLIILGDRMTQIFSTTNGKLSNTKRLSGAMQSDRPAAQLASLRISLGLAGGDHDVLATAALPATGAAVGALLVERQGNAADFSDLYTSPSDAQAESQA